MLIPGIAACMLLVVLHRGWIKDSVDYDAVTYVTSGQADDFRAQIASQMEILLDDSITECFLCPINYEQGPLMHMPVTADENAFTNTVVRDFYQKEKVVMIVDNADNE